MSGVSCIGRIGGRAGDWYAELDWEAHRAIVWERTHGGRAVVAEVDLGEVVPEDDDHYSALKQECPQNQRLCAIVFAPEAWAMLRDVQARLIRATRQGLTADECQAIADEIGDVMECLDVPGREEE